MRHLTAVLLALALSQNALAADKPAAANPHAGMSMPANPHAGGMPANPHGEGIRNPTAKTVAGKGSVQEVLTVPQFTYIHLLQDGRSVWLAAPTTAVKKGDALQYSEGMTMNNFYSKHLKRLFQVIVFVDKVSIEKK